MVVIEKVREALSTIKGNWAQDIIADREKRAQADELLDRCDFAADLWEGKFDAAVEIRQMRQEKSA